MAVYGILKALGYIVLTAVLLIAGFFAKSYLELQSKFNDEIRFDHQGQQRVFFVKTPAGYD